MPDPGAFAFDAAYDDLYARGWPYLRTLTEEAVPPKQAIKQAKKGLEAIDPWFGTAIPREVARRYLYGWQYRRHDQGALVVPAVESPGPIDRAFLLETLENKCSPSPRIDYGGETYDFRLAEVFFLFEAFLGTEVVAEALVAHLVRARDEVALWGRWVDHHHTEARRLVPVLGWLRLRMPPERWRAMIAPLRGEPPGDLPDYGAHLQALVGDRPSDEIDLALQARDPKPGRALLAEWNRYWHDPQLFYVVGADALLDVSVAELVRLPKWWQLQIVAHFGTIRAPGTARVIAALLGSRSAAQAATAWLQAHAEWLAAEAIPTLTARRDPCVPALVAAASGQVVAPGKVDRAALRREIKALFVGLEASLAALGGDPERGLAHLGAVFTRYAEINAALDDVIPEAYFTHELADYVPRWKADDETSQRWVDLAVKVSGG